MNVFLQNIQSLAAEEQISLTKASVSELQKIFLEEFYCASISQGWILIGGANLKFVYGQRRHTKDIDFGCVGNTFQHVNETLASLKFIEYRLEKRIGLPVSIKIDEGKTTARIFVHCQEIGGFVSFEVEFTHFKILATPEKAKVGQTLVLGSNLKEMKVSKILSLILRHKMAVRDLFDIFINPEPIDSSLLNQYLKKFKKKKSGLRKVVEHIQRNLSKINSRLIEELREDLGVTQVQQYISNSMDTALIERVLREIKAFL